MRKEKLRNVSEDFFVISQQGTFYSSESTYAHVGIIHNKK
jgi:hypothetical protein